MYHLLISFADSFKIQYMQFMAYMKTPQYKASLQQLLEQEKVGLIFNISKPNCQTTRYLRCGGKNAGDQNGVLLTSVLHQANYKVSARVMLRLNDCTWGFYCQLGQSLCASISHLQTVTVSPPLFPLLPLHII